MGKLKEVELEMEESICELELLCNREKFWERVKMKT